MDFREMIARRGALKISDAQIINLGFGMSMAVANYIPAGIIVILQSENGCLNFGPTPKLSEQDSDIANMTNAIFTVAEDLCEDRLHF